ncbi:MAG: 50S ribosomal protein L21 [Patescibacteria group bacterium]
MTLAVIKTGGKQYLVQEGDTLEIERVVADDKGVIEFAEVLMIGDDKGVKLGAPTLEGAKVTAELVEDFRDDKVIVFKMKRRKRYRKTQGHRQNKTRVKITKIEG